MRFKTKQELRVVCPRKEGVVREKIKVKLLLLVTDYISVSQILPVR